MAAQPANQTSYHPHSLYGQASDVVTTNYNSLKHELAQLPVPVAIDVYEKMCVNGQLCQLSFELGDLNVFMRTILHGLGKQHVLHRCVQALMDHGSKTVGVLAKQFTQRAALITSVGSDALDFAKLGQILATFLFDAGWYAECEQVLTASLRLVADSNDSDWQLLEFNLTVRLLSTYNNYCQFANGRKLFEEFSERIERGICASGTTGASEWNIAQAYIEFSSLFFMQSKYDDAYKWSMRALSALTPKSPVLTTIDVLRQAAKSCVVKRSFKRAELLITQALIVANQKIVKLREDMVDDVFADASELHPKISDLFSDYGFYLLNVDLIAQSVKFYDLALGARLKLFTGKPCDPDAECNNLLVAISCEDLAYSTYVFEYSSGRFEEASMQAERALKMMQKLLPSEHLLLASAKRIKALILEEIAIDHHDKDAEKRMLKESQELHLSALDLAIKAFGNDNVQTAKHYGNLGRLYQSMHNYEEAETMHLKAIAIKESLLGPDDFEVALSLGHLASLYNYDLLWFEKAEGLYLRSIKIGIALFGEAYSGLEYDYRGLLRVYLNLQNQDKTMEYMSIIHRWKHLRDDLNLDAEEETILSKIDDMYPMEVSTVYSNAIGAITAR